MEDGGGMGFLIGDLRRSLTEEETFWETGEEADDPSHMVTQESSRWGKDKCKVSEEGAC